MDLGEHRAAGDRHDDAIGQPPAELLGDLEGQRLRAFRVVRPHVDVDERPAVVDVGDLAAQPIDVVVVAVDGNDGRLVGRGRDDLGRLEIGRNEDARSHAGLGRVRGHRAGQVARRGAAQDRKPELERLGAGDRDGPILERVGRVDGVVLDPQVAQPQGASQVVGAHQRRKARVRVDDVLALDRQQGAVAPQCARPALDRRTRDKARERRRSRRRPRAVRSTARTRARPGLDSPGRTLGSAARECGRSPTAGATRSSTVKLM